MIAVANVRKGQTYMSYKGELLTLTKLSIRHQVCPGETYRTTILETTITMEACPLPGPCLFSIGSVIVFHFSIL